MMTEKKKTEHGTLIFGNGLEGILQERKGREGKEACSGIVRGESPIGSGPRFLIPDVDDRLRSKAMQNPTCEEVPCRQKYGNDRPGKAQTTPLVMTQQI